MKKAKVYYNKILAGYLLKDNSKFFFEYDSNYIKDENLPAISLSLPKVPDTFESNILFPFFYGLLPEGENKDILCRTLKIDPNDYFELLLKTTDRDSIGAITIKEEE